MKTYTCGGCNGQNGQVVQQGGGADLHSCDGCGGLIGRATVYVLDNFIGFRKPMQANAEPENLRYFDVDVVYSKPTTPNRVHGWFDATTRRVVQWG